MILYIIWLKRLLNVFIYIRLSFLIKFTYTNSFHVFIYVNSNFFKEGFIMNNIIGTQKLAHVGFVVEDLDATCEHFAKILGMPTPKKYGGLPPFEVSQTVYKGTPSPDVSIRSAHFKLENGVSLEFIEPNHAPSAWREFLDKHGSGMHHLAFKLDDLGTVVEDMEKEGVTLDQYAIRNNSRLRYVYLDATDKLSCFLELTQPIID